jgi:hypothetical protein
MSPMIQLIQRVEFWIAMGFALVVKLKASSEISRLQAASTIVVAICGALVFTEPACLYFGFTSDSVKYAMAALVGLTCEHVARMLLTLTISDVVALWKGRAP